MHMICITFYINQIIFLHTYAYQHMHMTHIHTYAYDTHIHTHITCMHARYIHFHIPNFHSSLKFHMTSRTWFRCRQTFYLDQLSLDVIIFNKNNLLAFHKPVIT